MTFNLWGGNVLLTLKKREKNTSSHVPNKIWMWSRILFLQNSNAFRIRSNHASWRIFVRRRGWVSKRKAWKQGSQKCYKMAENTTMAQTTSPPPLLWRLTWNAELTALEDGPWRLRQHHHPPPTSPSDPRGPGPSSQAWGYWTKSSWLHTKSEKEG